MPSVISSSLFFAHQFPWFEEHFLHELLECWMKRAPRPNGCFHVCFDREWNPREQPFATLVSQSRLLYLFSSAYRHTRNNELRRIVFDGARFLTDKCADKERGGFCWSFTDNGEWVDTTRDAYGHAFVLLGLAHAFDITADTSSLNGALRALECLSTRFCDPAGGMIWKMSPLWDDCDPATRSQNPIMHTVEAMLAFVDILQRRKPPLPAIPGGYEQVCQQTRKKVAKLIKGLFLDSTQLWRVPLPEQYTRTWEPLDSRNGGSFVTGHQFEWAFLLSEAVRHGMGNELIEAGTGLIEDALRNGCDLQRGIVWSSYDETGALQDRTLSWWACCEAIRALLRYGHDHGRESLLEPCNRFIEFARRHFIDPRHKGWYQVLDEYAEVLEGDKGSVWKLDYHQTALCLEAMRLAH